MWAGCSGLLEKKYNSKVGGSKKIGNASWNLVIRTGRLQVGSRGLFGNAVAGYD